MLEAKTSPERSLHGLRIVEMKRNEGSSLVLVLVFLLVVSVTFSIMSVEASGKHHHKKSKSHKHRKDKGGPASSGPAPAPAPLPPYGSYPPQTSSKIFNVLSFGAKGDGVTDDSKALLAAWKAACKLSGATLEIPSEFHFLIKPITLQGPCMPHLVLQIDGNLLAPPKVGSWPKSGLFQWLNFKWVQNFTIQGNGTVDGQGSEWWTASQIYSIQKKSKHIPDIKPTALRFYASYKVTVRDIKIINSPQCHLKFDSSGGVKVSNIQISSPENSPNTDGIHLQNTQNVEILHSNIGCVTSPTINYDLSSRWCMARYLLQGNTIGSRMFLNDMTVTKLTFETSMNKKYLYNFYLSDFGDDCVSIQTGCSNIHIRHINCGPGHGISLGGLGKDKSVACVSDIVVEKISVTNTLAGVRIKTWQGGIGSVKNISFSSIQVSDVKVPIIIDQYYCDKHFCKNETGAVAISGVKYNQIIGTYSVQPIHLACSNDIPCTDVDLIDIQLKPSSRNQYFQKALCWNSFGKSRAPLVPSSIDYCLRRDVSGSVRRIAKSQEDVC